ncbi:MAG TPA: hypothetical protein VFO65_07095 [Acidimicrobiales bacterium]|nr:hypothetical protein [Acidimicrobiales bacterium]
MTMTNRTLTTRLAGILCLGALVGAGAACGDDGGSGGGASRSTTLTSAFCEAKADLDAVSPDTPDEAALRRYQKEATPLLARMDDEAPGGLADAVTTVRDSIVEPDSLEEAGAAATDEDVAAAKEAIGTAVHEQCGFEEATFVAADHRFEDTPGTLARGRSSLVLDNRGEALHALVVFRVNEDVADADIAGLVGSEELESRASFVNAMPAAGGHVAQLVVDLEPGRYLFFDDEHMDDMVGTFTVE